MAESKHDQVWEALKALFAGIVGDDGVTYWYTPDAVIDFADFGAQCLDTSKDVIYCLSPGVSEVNPFTFSDTHVSAQIKLSLAKKFQPLAENAFDPSETTRLRIQNRLVQDATRKLNSANSGPNWTLGGLALRAGVTLEDRTSEETYYNGWAIVHLMLRVDYVYQDDEP